MFPQNRWSLKKKNFHVRSHDSRRNETIDSCAAEIVFQSLGRSRAFLHFSKMKLVLPRWWWKLFQLIINWHSSWLSAPVLEYEISQYFIFEKCVKSYAVDYEILLVWWLLINRAHKMGALHTSAIVTQFQPSFNLRALRFYWLQYC